MSNTITLSQSAYKELLTRMNRLEKMVSSLLERFEQEPTYGSEAWWMWSDKKALEDIKKGSYRTFESVKDMKKYLQSL